MSWRDEYLKWVCGFANAQGGTIVVGKDDHMTIWNEGPLPRTIPAEALTGPHASVPRNPLIADICFKAGYIDSWGRGIQKITDACTDAHLPNPKFEDAFGGVLVTLTPQAAGEVTAPVTTPVTPPPSAYVQRLLELLNDRGALGNSAIRETFGLKSRRRLRDTYIDPALEKELIEATIPEKPTSRLQKYRLTDKGRAMLEKLKQ